MEGRRFTREDLYTAIMAGAVERVRPKMMTVFAIMAGLLPIMWSHGTGAEVMQRIAVPMIGGMVSSTLLTLIVIPATLEPDRNMTGPSLAEIWNRKAGSPGELPALLSCPQIGRHHLE
jgi:copper/silver efflux system protein